MSYKLIKPYKNNQKTDFIVEYNHNKGLIIEETSEALYALEPNEIMQDGVPVINPEYEAEQKIKEREKINMLSLTAADVERAIYKAKGMDFEDIIELVNSEIVKSEELINDSPDSSPLTNHSIDLKALKIELKANNFYRGNPYVEIIGGYLGYSSEDLDYLFENGEFPAVQEEVSND